jgi:poly(3-hydroxyalkanoate) synthetase
LAGGLENRAAAVVQADAARAGATLGYPAGKASLAAVLAAVEAQRAQTFAFLQTLADYNQAWAGYTLALLSPDAPAEALAAALLPPQR